MSKTFFAIVVVPVAGTLFGIFGYGWYAYNLKPIVEAKAAVAGQLFDPSSAQYRNVRIMSLGDVCGEVNAKNKLGGYVGFRPFSVSKFGGKTSVLLDSDTLHLAELHCKEK